MTRFFALAVLVLSLAACDKPSDNTAATAPALNQCMKDTDCKGERICESGQGVMNLMESVVEYPDETGYVAVEKAYAFGPNKYVLIVSTGENGRSCPATTYALSFDIQGEYVDGSTEIDGCSELVEAFADGNKLSIKKEGETTVIYNAEIK